MSDNNGRPTDERVRGWLHSAFQEMPDRNLSIAAGRWSQVLTELLALRSQVERLQRLLETRPSIRNVNTVGYVKWSEEVDAALSGRE